jgi:hypothetical protein
MAKRNSMSTARLSRNRHRASANQTGSMGAYPGDQDDPRLFSPVTSKRVGLDEVICSERKQLMKAEAVLGCVAFALLYEEWFEGPNRPSFTDAVAVARDLVHESVARLERNELPSQMEPEIGS